MKVRVDPVPWQGHTLCAMTAPGAFRLDDGDGQRFKEGERLWLSWAMANRDPSLFPDPDTIDLARIDNRHHGFGLGIHRCIGSHLARTEFKPMITHVLDRMPDYVRDPDGAMHYDSIGVIQGIRHLPATFTPGRPPRTRTRQNPRDPAEALRRTATQRPAEPITTE